MNQTEKNILSKFVRLLRKKKRAVPEIESGPVVEMIEPVLKPLSPIEGKINGTSGTDEEPIEGIDLLTIDAPGPRNEDADPDARNESSAPEFNKSEAAGALLKTVSTRQSNVMKFDKETSDDPGFNIFANARLWRREQADQSYSGEVAKLYRDVFTPTRPKKTYQDFSGRRDIVQTIIQTVEEERAHVVLFGEQGLGKTSLANILIDCAKKAGYLVAHVTGSKDLTFEQFILVILEQFSTRIEQAPVGDLLQKRLGAEDLTDLVDSDPLDIPTTIRIFKKLADNQALVLVDDFERIENSDFKVKLAELMEVLSDQGAWLSLMLFGRASRPIDLLPESVQSSPNVTWLKLQPMTQDEAEQVVRRGAAAIGIHFNDDVIDTAVHLSQGVPIALQWLCLLAVRRATQRYATEVEIEDLADVVRPAATKIDPRLSARYDEICGRNRNGWADDILFLAVQTPIQENGVFLTEDMSRIALEAIGRPLLELPLHSALSRLSCEKGSQVLEKVWTVDGTGYRFANPTMRSIVMMKNAGRLTSASDRLLGQVEEIDLLPSPGAA